MQQNAYQLLCICILVTASLFFIGDVLQIHRINSFSEVKSILLASSRPLESSHCRVFNASHHQCLPNALIIGASKAGTTTLVNYLRQFKRIHFVDRRLTKTDNHTEVHRFDRASYGRAWKSIELLHEWASSPIIGNKNDLVIHYTPHYLYAPTVPFEMSSFYPHSKEIKFIISIRDPVDRMWSSYWFKNSHLFHEEDQGNLEEFHAVIQRQLQDSYDRETYELCMIEQLETSSMIALIGNVPVPVIPTTSHGNASYTFNFNQSTTLRYLNYLHAFTQLWLVCEEKKNVHSTSIYNSHPISRCAYAPALDDTTLLSYYRDTFDTMTRKCFGSSMLRAKQLGLRHVEKSIYYDQVLRWFLNFSPTQFHFLSLAEIAASPKEMLSQLFYEMEMKELVCETASRTASRSIDNEGGEKCDALDAIEYDKLTKLSKPNKKSTVVQLSELDRQSLRVYFQPYDTFFQRLVFSGDILN